MYALQVSCGARHTAVLTAAGKLLSFGLNKFGQMGLGHASNADVPQIVHAPAALMAALQAMAGSRLTMQDRHQAQQAEGSYSAAGEPPDVAGMTDLKGSQMRGSRQEIGNQHLLLKCFGWTTVLFVPDVEDSQHVAG